MLRYDWFDTLAWTLQICNFCRSERGWFGKRIGTIQPLKLRQLDHPAHAGEYERESDRKPSWVETHFHRRRNCWKSRRYVHEITKTTCTKCIRKRRQCQIETEMWSTDMRVTIVRYSKNNTRNKTHGITSTQQRWTNEKRK